MSGSDLVRILAAVVSSTDREAGDTAVARAIVTGLSAAGYEVVRTRPAAGAPARVEPDEARESEPRPVRKAG